MKHFTFIEGAPKAVGPYSVAVVSNGVAYLAGQIGLDPERGVLVGDGFGAQFGQVLKNLEAVLDGVGSGKSRILQTTVFLTSSADGAECNELYAKWLGELAMPARQTVVVKELPLGAKVEASLLAAV